MRLRLLTTLALLGVVLAHTATCSAASSPMTLLTEPPSLVQDGPIVRHELLRRGGDPGASTSGTKDPPRPWRPFFTSSPSPTSASAPTTPPPVPWHKFKEPLYSSPVQHWRSLFRHGPPQTKSEPSSPQNSKQKSMGRAKSLPTSPATPAWSYHSLSSLGSFRASPDSVKSQPPSPLKGKKPRGTYTLTKPKRNTWFGWFKKEKHITAAPTYKNDKIKSPAHLHDKETRKYKTFFYGKKAKQYATIVRPSVLRSEEGHQKQKLRKLMVKTAKKLGKEFG